MTTNRWISLAAATALTACGGGQASAGQHAGGNPPPGGEQHPTPLVTTNAPADAGAAAAGTPGAAAVATLPPVTVTAGTSTPIPPNLHPRVAIAAPANNSVVRTNRVEVHLHVTDWPAPQDGRHVHLILDNEPYRRVDDPSRPVVLENLAEGTHVLRAFPGWMTHESVKTPGAFALTVFSVGRRTEHFDFNPTAPLLTYSRPKGDYNGADAEHILLDCYITNIPGNALAPAGYRAHYAIDGATSGDLTAWTPYYIDHLPDGPHTITLDLLGPDGQPVAGMFNHTERHINVNRAAPAAGHDHGAAPPAGTAPAASPAAGH